MAHLATTQPTPKRDAEDFAGAPREAGAGTRQGRDAEVQVLLDRFARALTAGDGEAAADVWQAPAFVIGAGMARPVSSRDEVVQFFAGAKAQYDALGITDTHPEVLRFDWVTDELVVVDVRWPYLDAAGKEHGEERSSYTLLRDENGAFKIRHVLMRGAK
jgi:hypothetical protein